MINRRHIRIKVMQSIYAIQKTKNNDLIKQEKFLKFSIDKMVDLYVLNFQLIIEVKKLAKKKIELSKKKILATKSDLKPNKKFINNKIINLFEKSKSLFEYIELKKINNWELNNEYVRIILDELQKSDFYKNYMNSKIDSFQQDKDFIITFFKKIIAPNEKLAEFYEDTMITWVDDIPFINTWVVKTINKLNPKNSFVLGGLYKDEDDEKFVLELFNKTLLNQNKFDKDIQEKTPNWEKERIADVDMIILKMGVTEFLYFNSIPCRVTINEYIEISKDYSTNKSGYFINGVLDKLSKDYKTNGKINKIGRGLI